VNLFLTDGEIDAMCEGVRFNATKVRRLRSMGLVVNTKPNGKPLIVRTHAEAVLSGRAETDATQTSPSAQRPTTGDRDAVIALFGNRKAA
jgi:hypothetical protein